MSDTDRELLELAAKAAGIRLEWDGHPNQWLPMYYEGKTYRLFDPLTDDGDALQLAVKLSLRITPYPIYEDPKHSVIVLRHQNAVQQVRTPHNPTEVVESYGANALAATRRAIVRAAAEIGRAAQ